MAGWYSKRYREEYSKHFSQSKDQTLSKYLDKPKSRGQEENIFSEVKETIEKESEKAWEYLSEPKHVKIIKILAIILAASLFLFLIYSNFISSQEFDYDYDIGSPQDVSKPYLSPIARVSEPFAENISHRNLTSNLVYFDVPVARGSKTITIQTKFKPNSDQELFLGAKDQQIWHYKYKTLYNPTFDNLSSYPKKGVVYTINPKLENITIDQISSLNGKIIASDLPLENSPSDVIEGYYPKTVSIKTALRGAHKFYIYTDRDLKINIKKQDINWYDGADPLDVSLYSAQGELVSSITIPDDGIEIRDSSNPLTQEATLQTENLPVGVYILEFSDFDGLITEIKLNTNKIVSDKLFLASNQIYGVPTKDSRIYVRSDRSSSIKFLTYHAEGIQEVNYNDEVFDFYDEDKTLSLEIEKGEYFLTIPNNDVIVSYPGYISFSKEGYFEPYKNTIIPIGNDFDSIKNVDYIVTDYHEPTYVEDWIVSSVVFDIEEDELFIKDNKLSLVFHSPSLSSDPQNSTISIDEIKIKVSKPGI